MEEKKYHTTLEGVTTEIKDLTTSHLENIIKYKIRTQKESYINPDYFEELETRKSSTKQEVLELGRKHNNDVFIKEKFEEHFRRNALGEKQFTDSFKNE